MNAEPAQMVPASGWTGGRMLGVDRVYHVVAGEVLQPIPKESRFGLGDDALWRARGLCHVWTAPVYGASAGMWRAETRRAPSASISNNSRDGHDANDVD
jgi:hypothetical protein